MFKDINDGILFIAQDAEYYKERFLRQKYPDKSWINNINDNLRFLFGHAAYQGRPDYLSKKVDNAAQEKFKTLIALHGADHVFHPDYESIVMDEMSTVIGKDKGKAGRENDIDLVKGLLKFISKYCDDNLIIPYTIEKINNNEIQGLYKELIKLPRIADKIATFYLRDVVSYFELEDCLKSDDDLKCIQPIDTWVRKIVWAAEISQEKKDPKIKRDIIDKCKDAGVRAHEFNMGAWLNGAKAFNMYLWKNFQKELDV
ncbi:hypothetical protein [Methanosarcina mazei]|uniref:Uncharacterized protein n=1 Tax=Methanosarcina mazei TaxID=2209 RepID=A0A0F8EX26_METMZ|nr:hypothetical protein [Methanosarcina mazei]KKG34634.1 hypothetical protein DU30_00365 [Methanosarcina mazei]KKG64498.1 hypothetical protein DU67_07475 [Methanosarcina mazei]